MPIYLVIYWMQTVYSFGVKHVVEAIPTTMEESEKEIAKRRNILFGASGIGPILQIEYVAREDTSFLWKDAGDAKHGFNPDGTFDEEKFNKLDYNDSKEWRQ